jgi:serine-type D-Ala-D-Ala carboxypeptidase (penicillin-binding protein 5/6)
LSLKYRYTPRRYRRGVTGGFRVLAAAFGLFAGVIFLGLFVVGSGSGLPDCETEEECAVLVLDKESNAPPATGGDGGPARTPEAGPQPPPLTGRAAVVMEEPCRELLFDRNPDMRLPPASLTKIVTAIVVRDQSEPSEVANITVNGPELSMETDSTVMGLEPGQRLTVLDLLYGLLLPSGNDAALALAEHISGDVPAFVDLMNQKAEELGLRGTHFSNPHGLDQGGLFTTARDMALAGALLLEDPLLADIVKTLEHQPAWDGPPVPNVNGLMGFYQGAVGIKTGYTDDAGPTIVAAAERDGRLIIASVLNSPDLYFDASALLEWAFEQESVCSPGQTPAPTP